MSKTNDLVTKDHLDKRLTRFKKELKQELRTDLVEVADGLKKELRADLVEVADGLKKELKNELIEIKDEIVGEIKAAREESDVHQYQHQGLNDTLEDHETRLQKLEKPGSM